MSVIVKKHFNIVCVIVNKYFQHFSLIVHSIFKYGGDTLKISEFRGLTFDECGVYRNETCEMSGDQYLQSQVRGSSISNVAQCSGSPRPPEHYILK